MFNMSNLKLLITLFIGIATVKSTSGLDPFPPELDFQPKPSEANAKNTLIWYKANDPNSFEHLINTLDEFLKPYSYVAQNIIDGNFHHCNSGIPPVPDSNQICTVKIDSWIPCTKQLSYNFNSSTGGPCVFLSLKQTNRTIGWLPEFYNTSTIPSGMPNYVQTRIAEIESIKGPDSNGLHVVWVACTGSNPEDIENIGPIRYYPRFGFGGEYFPYLNADNYLSPLVAVYFEQPTREVLINIECKLWTRNINRNPGEHIGILNFQLLVD